MPVNLLKVETKAKLRFRKQGINDLAQKTRILDNLALNKSMKKKRKIVVYVTSCFCIHLSPFITIK